MGTMVSYSYVRAKMKSPTMLTNKTSDQILAYLKNQRDDYMARAFGYFEPDALYRSIVGDHYEVLMAANKLWNTMESTSIKYEVSLPYADWSASLDMVFKGYVDLMGPGIYLLPQRESVGFGELDLHGETSILGRMLRAEMQWQESIDAFTCLMGHFAGTQRELATYVCHITPWVADLFDWRHLYFFTDEHPAVQDVLRRRIRPKHTPLLPKFLLDICRLPQMLLAQLEVLKSVNAVSCPHGHAMQPPGTCSAKFHVRSDRLAKAFIEAHEASRYEQRSNF